MKIHRKAGFIALIYLTIGIVWIVASDKILLALIEDPILLTQIQTYKGWLFTLISTILIYTLTYSFMKDINKANSNISSLLSKTLSDNETEKKHITNTLDNEYAQVLAFVKMRMKIIKDALNEGDSKIQEIDEIETEINKSFEKLKKFVHTLRPVIIDDFTLNELLKYQLESFKENSRLDYDFNGDDLIIDLTNTKKIYIFRIVDELLSVIRTERQLKKLIVNLDDINDTFRITIEFDGFMLKNRFNYSEAINNSFNLIREWSRLASSTIKINDKEKTNSIEILIPHHNRDSE